MKPPVILSSVVRPALQALTPYNAAMASPAAEVLIMGTLAQESDMCAYSTQIGGGPALGIGQVERNTHTSMWTHFILPRPALCGLIDKYLCLDPVTVKAKRDPRYLQSEEFHSQLEYNWRYSIGMIRLVYWPVLAAMPAEDDLLGLGQYYKDHFNTRGGRGSAAEWVESYRYFVLGERT